MHTKTPRLDVVDALRGFAVMAILLIHCVEHFIFSVYPTSQPHWLNVIDQGTFSVIFSLFAGKAYAIFAILFGFTFHVQYTNQQLQGKDFGYRFLWRLVLLTGFATINAAFFPGGDVLMLFALLGVVLFALRQCSDKVLLICAIIFLLQPLEWVRYIASGTAADLGVGEMYAQIGQQTLHGSFWDFICTNVTTGQKASLLWAVGAGRLIQTAGLFLLGMLIGRRKLFQNSSENTKFWGYALIIAALLFAPLYQLKVELADLPPIVSQNVGVVMDMWQKLAFTVVIMASFVLLYQNEKFRHLTSNLRLYGKMSLTNYISQSILGALIFFPFGLYLAPHCGYTASLLIGVALLAAQLCLCKWWLKTHKQGPLEAIWHKLTWLSLYKKKQ